MFLIETEEKYPADYDETDEQGGRENRERTRPKLASHIQNMDDYDTIFLGYPNWYYDMPMAVYAFLEEYDFSGKRIIPFVTSGGSGFSDSISEIKKIQPGAEVEEDGFKNIESGRPRPMKTIYIIVSSSIVFFLNIFQLFALYIKRQYCENGNNRSIPPKRIVLHRRQAT